MTPNRLMRRHDNIVTPAASPPSETIQGIQWLRALASVVVVVWHMGGVGLTGLFDPSLTGGSAPVTAETATWRDVVHANGMLLAVPVFMLVSSYLLSIKGAGRDAVVRQTKRLALLLAFWPLALTIWKGGWPQLWNIAPSGPGSAAEFVLRAGGNLYYFFVSLILCLLLTHACRRLPTAALAALTLGWCALLAALPRWAILYDAPILSAYWCPLNFVPYAFAGLLLARLPLRSGGWRHAITAASAAACVALACWEWRWMVDPFHLGGQAYAFPSYTRPSLVCGAITVLIFFGANVNTLPKSVGFMAKQSLALYCLHPFFIRPVSLVFEKLNATGAAAHTVQIVTVVGLSYAAAFALKAVLNPALLSQSPRRNSPDLDQQDHRRRQLHSHPRPAVASAARSAT